MPLSGIALCEAEMTTPRSAPRSPVRNATAGVGSTPSSSTSTPAEARPGGDGGLQHLAAGPRVAAERRPAAAAGGRGRAVATAGRTPRRRPRGRRADGAGRRGARARRAAAVARRRASAGVRSALASPRTPSVPNSRPTAASALRVLGRLAGLLQAVLLALLGPRVAGEEAGLLQRRAGRSRRARSAPGRWPAAARRPGR